MEKAPVDYARDASELLAAVASKKGAFDNEECQGCEDLGKLGLPRSLSITGDSYIASNFDGSCVAGQLIFVCDIRSMGEDGVHVAAISSPNFLGAMFALAMEAIDEGVKNYRLVDAEYVLQKEMNSYGGHNLGGIDPGSPVA